jgi:hypothetical protein
MRYRVTHRGGEMEMCQDLASIDVLIDELDADDPEHPDVAVGNGSGWVLSAFAGGLVVLENPQEDVDPRHRYCTNRAELRDLLTALATGDVATVEAVGWQPGYGS